MSEKQEDIEFSDDFANPLDRVEDILKSNNWTFSRISDEELNVKVQGKNCSYDLLFIWQNDMGALQFCCEYNLSINADKMNKAAMSLLSINENLWMGHFDIPKNTNHPTFRHTCLLRGMEKTSGSEYIEDMVEIGLTLCEQYYSAFYLLSHANDANDANDQTLSLALMETAGEC